MTFGSYQGRPRYVLDNVAPRPRKTYKVEKKIIIHKRDALNGVAAFLYKVAARKGGTKKEWRDPHYMVEIRPFSDVPGVPRGYMRPTMEKRFRGPPDEEWAVIERQMAIYMAEQALGV